MTMMFEAAAVVLAYLLGALSGALLLAGVFGQEDLRHKGSGNAGATNALRTGGRTYGAAVLLFDLVKGVVAVTLLPWLFGLSYAWVLACGAACVIGHVYPVYFGFRGGKGVATLSGVLLAALPVAFGVGIVVWLLTLTTTGFVGLAALLGMAAVMVWCLATHAAMDATTIFSVVMTALVCHAHRGNIVRMCRGQEPRHARLMWRKPEQH